jgi:hypothetical protein
MGYKSRGNYGVNGCLQPCKWNGTDHCEQVQCCKLPNGQMSDFEAINETSIPAAREGEKVCSGTSD